MRLFALLQRHFGMFTGLMHISIVRDGFCRERGIQPACAVF